MGDDVDADGTAWARACAADAVKVNMARGRVGVARTPRSPER